jgi:hypothetical protein
MVDPMRRSSVASMIESTATNPELALLHGEFLAAQSAPLTNAVDRAVTAGAAPANLDPAFAAELLAAPIIVRALVRADPLDRRYVDRVVHEVLGGNA